MKAWAFIVHNSLLLVAGALSALIWANVDLTSYERFAHGTVQFATNDIGMALFFALATKEIIEARLPGGPLASAREAAVPVIAAVGGMAGPALVYVALASALDRPELYRGWAVPCATDIAFSYMAARMIFPANHPGIPFLLLLAIADDALYPTGPLSIITFAALMVPAIGLSYALKKFRTISFWPYLAVGGGLSWCAMDTMNRFEHFFKIPVQLILFFFGFVNAGVPLGGIGTGTGIVALALLIGKPIGIVTSTVVSIKAGLRAPGGLTTAHTVVLGVAAGIGFTVALFFATAAFPPGPVLDEVKMGSLLSFLAAPCAILLGRSVGLRPGGSRIADR